MGIEGVGVSAEDHREFADIVISVQAVIDLFDRPVMTGREVLLWALRHHLIWRMEAAKLAAHPFELVERTPAAVPLSDSEAPATGYADFANAGRAASKAVVASAAPDSAAQIVTGPFSIEERKIAKRMMERGASAREISRRLRRALGSVTMLLRRLELAAEKKRAEDAARAEQCGRAEEVTLKPAAPETASAEPSTASRPDRETAGNVASELTGENRRIWLFLDKLGDHDGFGPQMDAELVAALAGGARAPEFAADFGLDTKAVVERFKALSACVLDRHGRVSTDGQQRLLAMLKARALRAAKDAAK